MGRMVTLPSGAVLDITPAPFSESKALYMAVAEEIMRLKMNGDDEIDTNLIKDVICCGVSSKKIDSTLEICMGRVTYNKEKISKDTFEPVEARQDYLIALYEVAYDNVLPFLKGFAVKYESQLKVLKNFLDLQLKTKTS